MEVGGGVRGGEPAEGQEEERSGGVFLDASVSPSYARTWADTHSHIVVGV